MEISRSPVRRSRFHSSTKNRNFALAEGFQTIPRQANGWTLFLRYQAQTERLYRRAVEEFDRLKALRPELRNEAIEGIQSEENEPPSAPPAEPIRDPICTF